MGEVYTVPNKPFWPDAVSLEELRQMPAGSAIIYHDRTADKTYTLEAVTDTHVHLFRDETSIKISLADAGLEPYTGSGLWNATNHLGIPHW